MTNFVGYTASMDAHPPLASLDTRRGGPGRRGPNSGYRPGGGPGAAAQHGGHCQRRRNGGPVVGRPTHPPHLPPGQCPVPVLDGLAALGHGHRVPVARLTRPPAGAKTEDHQPQAGHLGQSAGQGRPCPSRREWSGETSPARERCSSSPRLGTDPSAPDQPHPLFVYSALLKKMGFPSKS